MSVLSRDYISVYAVNLQTGKAKVLKLANERIASSFKWQAEREIQDYDAAIAMYAEKFVEEKNRDEFLKRKTRYVLSL